MTPAEVRLTLHRAGFTPLPVVGKRPIIDGWQKHTDVTAHEIDRWTRACPAAGNTGILTRLAPVLDVDILDPEAAEAVENLVRERFEEHGYVLVRFGAPPKRAIPFRTDTPFAKIVTKLVAPDGSDGQRLELMCDGQQVVVAGVHPDTHRPYSWHGGAPGQISRLDLPYLHETEARELVEAAAELLIRDFGYRLPQRRAALPASSAQGNGADWSQYFANLSDHDDLARLAMALLRSGMNDGAAVNFLRGAVDGLVNVDQDRKARRMREISFMVTSARLKLGAASASQSAAPEKCDEGVRIQDFVAYMQSHDYVYMPAGDFWPTERVNARLPPIAQVDSKGQAVLNETTGEPKTIRPSDWLARNAPVEQMTWAPGLPQLIRDRLVGDGGWIDRKGVTVLNLYRPPRPPRGDAAKAGPWIKHVTNVYPDEAGHIIGFLAHRVQRPEEKINHGLVLGGSPGIGKDTMLEPVKLAVGPWNFAEASPQQMLGRFNGFLKSVVLRISEAKDMGEVDRFKFYAHMKTYLAAPPDVLRVDEKNLREHSVFNICGVIMTTNHKTDGIYLPADDRRHFVAWSDKTIGDFTEAYWNNLWKWYEREGFGHVGAYLAGLDLSNFNPKAAPEKTPAFWAIVDASRAPEDAELADILDAISQPDAVTLDKLINNATGEIEQWLLDRKNRRVIPHRLEQCGYVPVRNQAAADGLFKISGRRQVVYARAGLTVGERLRAAGDLAR